jgi:putative transcription factor
MNHQNWDTVVINGKQAPVKKDTNYASNAGPSSLKKKNGAGKNSNHGNGMPSLTKKLDTDELVAIPTVSRTLSQQIITARNNAGMTQKELAQKINEKVDVVKDFESGSALPNPNVVNKLQRVLNTTFTK